MSDKPANMVGNIITTIIVVVCAAGIGLVALVMTRCGG